jgi:heavy metal efflux system protein
LFRKNAKTVAKPGDGVRHDALPEGVAWAVRNRWLTVGVAIAAFRSRRHLSGVWRRDRIGILPHLDEGAIWVRGTLGSQHRTHGGCAVVDRARQVLCSFPEVPSGHQVGRPDDGTDTTGFFNTEYFVDLLPKEKWRPVFHQDKERLIAAMNRELEKIPGVIWNFSQPISDNWKKL